MFLFRPTNQDNLLKVEDMSVEKAQRYGKVFIEEIKKFCEQEKWSKDAMPDASTLNARVKYYYLFILLLLLKYILIANYVTTEKHFFNL